MLASRGSLRGLRALRRGPHGARAWNQRIEARLAREVPGFRSDQTRYLGRPILINPNDDGIRLYNGNLGVIFPDPDRPDKRIAQFPATHGTLPRLSPARLPTSETTFAMTIHRSQGSQFDHAVVVLPEVSSPVRPAN